MGVFARAVALVTLSGLVGCTTVGAQVERRRYVDRVLRIDPARLDATAIEADRAALTMNTGAVITCEVCKLSGVDADIVIASLTDARRVPRALIQSIDVTEHVSKKVLATARTDWSPADGLTFVLGIVAMGFVLAETLQ